MDPKKPFDQLHDSRKKAQDAIDRATEARTNANEQHRKKYAGEPYLIRNGNSERCSVCGHPFPADVKPSMSVAFAEHLMKAHQPGQ
jgi:rubrerythrin